MRQPEAGHPALTPALPQAGQGLSESSHQLLSPDQASHTARAAGVTKQEVLNGPLTQSRSLCTLRGMPAMVPSAPIDLSALSVSVPGSVHPPSAIPTVSSQSTLEAERTWTRQPPVRRATCPSPPGL